MKITLLLLAMLTLGSLAVSAQTATTLSAKQVETFKTLKVKTEKAAAPIAAKMAATVTRIYANMLSDHENQALRKRLGAQLHLYAGKLLDLKGESLREALRILTPEQRDTVRDALSQPGAPGDIGEVIEKTFGLAR
jgi:hypothetical protein